MGEDLEVGRAKTNNSFSKRGFFSGIKLVPIEQSELFATKLKEAGVPVELLRIEGAGHGFMGQDLQKAVEALFAFFDKHLKSGR